MLYIYSHNSNSESAKSLASSLDIKRVRRENSRFRGNENKTVINWGASALPDEIRKCVIINQPDLVSLCSNKLRFFEAMNEPDDPDCVRTPKFTTAKDVAIEWLQQGHTVCARQVLNGSSGEGLVLFDATEPFVEAPLYTMYVKKQDEYRIHVCNSQVISEQRKAIKTSHREAISVQNKGAVSKEDANYYYPNSLLINKTLSDHRVRNTANGYVFVRNEVTPPKDVINQALKVFDIIPMNFGAVDVIWNHRLQKAYVLEVNTAPGLEGTTLEHYTQALKVYKGDTK